MRILLVEDNANLVRSLAAGLHKAGMVVDAVGNGEHADQLLKARRYDATVLDLMLPRLGGLEVLRRVRARGDDVPVLILTVLAELPDRVRGLNAGADDYLAKPFELDELVARLHAIARRRAGRAHAVIRVGRLAYDTAGLLFTLDGEPLALTPREHGVLETLVGQAGRPVSKVKLAEQLCSLNDTLSPQALEVHVHRLRKKLEGRGLRINTLRGLGYLLEAAPDDDTAAATAAPHTRRDPDAPA